MIQLSTNFTLEEATASDTALRLGISNAPTSQMIEVLMRTAACMERVRIVLGTGIYPSSWYRCPALNTAVGSASTSQHISGEAVDFHCNILTPLQICKKLIEAAAYVDYDQLILEHTWVHISFAILSKRPRRQVLSLLTSRKYAVGLTDPSGHSL